MAKRTGKSIWERFTAAVTAADDEKAEELVVQLTQDDRGRLRNWLVEPGDRCWWGIRGLAEVGDETDVERVARFLNADDAETKAVALLALHHLHQRCPAAVQGWFSAIVRLLADEDGLVRQTAADVLARCGNPAIPSLTTALQTDDDGVRARAAAALHKMGTPQTAPPLYHHLDDPNPLVRHHAYEALDELGYLTNVLFAP